MKEPSNMSSSKDCSHNFLDLNCDNENVCNVLCEDSTIPNNEDVQATMEVDFADVTIDEMERRLAVDEIVENEDIAYALYCKYARVKGFSVRKGKNIMFRNGSGIQAKEFLCSREGLKDEKRSKVKVPEYQKTDSRCNCLAKLKIGRTKGGPWKVTKFYKDHNHNLYAPDETYLLRHARNITDEQELVLTSMLKAKVPISRAINFLENVADGRENVGFIPRDAYDCVSRVTRKTKIENGDSFELMQHFKNKGNSEPDFYWDVQVDDDNRLMNFFFRDCRCLIDYGHFGDVLSVDTTYRTNKYDMICAPFVGINHHNENILFGFALLSDETEITFKWLFRTFLKSMGDKQPGMAFTDQCQAMMNAVEDVFDESHHRLCQWHINQNAPSHFGKLNCDSNFKWLWKKCMSYCESKEEFEVTWKEMVDKYNVGEQNWFNIMYGLREKWATAFSNTIFSAGLMTTSRSEGTNSAFKQNIRNKTLTLLDCVIAYDKVQDNWRLKEKEKDILCHHNKPTLFVAHPLLKHAAEFYTLNMFKLFEKEFKDTMSLEILEKSTREGSSKVLYKVKSYEGKWYRTVQYDSGILEIKCSCHKFETVGILCRHALKVFYAENMRLIPDKYIEKRWSKSAKSEMCGSQSGNKSSLSDNKDDGNYIYEMAFVGHVTKEFRELAMQGKRNADTINIVMKYIESAKTEMQAWFEKMNINERTLVGDLVTNNAKDIHGDIVVRDPLVAKSRGVTNVHKRHWDDKKKKGKGKADTSKGTTKGVKRRGQNSQEASGGQNSHRVTGVQQFQPLQYPYSFANPPSFSYVGLLRDGTTSVQPLQYPYSFANLDPMARNISGDLNMMGNTYSMRDIQEIKGPSEEV